MPIYVASVMKPLMKSNLKKMSLRKKKMSNETTCPNCDSTDQTYEGVMIELDDGSRKRTTSWLCNNCRQPWDDIYFGEER